MLSLLFFAVYAALYFSGEALSGSFGQPHLLTVIFLSVGLIVFSAAALKKRAPAADFFRRPDRGAWLCLSPLLLFAGANLFFGLKSGGAFRLLEVLLFTLTAFCEELLFRADLLARALRFTDNERLSVIMNAALFAALHFANIGALGLPYTLLQVLSAFSMGFLLAAVTARFRSVLPGLLLHGLINAAGCLADVHPAPTFTAVWILASGLSLASGVLILRKDDQHEILH